MNLYLKYDRKMALTGCTTYTEEGYTDIDASMIKKAFTFILKNKNSTVAFITEDERGEVSYLYGFENGQLFRIIQRKNERDYATYKDRNKGRYEMYDLLEKEKTWTSQN